MRTAQILLLVLALLVLSPDVANSEMACETSIIKEGVCDLSDCASDCFNKLKGSGTCVPEGCKCRFCRRGPARAFPRDANVDSAGTFHRNHRQLVATRPRMAHAST